MKTIILIFILTSIHLSLYSQSGIASIGIDTDGLVKVKDTTFIHRMEFINGKTFEELQSDSSKYMVKNVQIYNYSILHFAVIPLFKKTHKYEFYRINDLKYRIVKFIDNKIIAAGVITNSPKPVLIDTLIQIDILRDLKNVYTITKYYKPVKTGSWNEIDKAGNETSGFYKNDKKHGQWYYSGKICPSFKYEKGEIVSLFCPNTEIIDEYKEYLYDKEFIYCNIQHKDWLLEFYLPKETNQYQPCVKSLKLALKKNFEFYCSGFEEETNSIKNGKGQWNINKEGQFVLKYSSGEIIKYEIDGFGPSFLNLKILKE